MALLREGMARHGAAVFAHHQTNGKGQRSRTWQSGKNENIALSTIIEPGQINIYQPFHLSMVAALAVIELLSELTYGDVSIKWPNDIYWRDRKAAGILIENNWRGQEWTAAVIGIGININQVAFGELQHSAVSLKQISGQAQDPIKLARKLCDIIDARLSSAFESTVEEYHQCLYKINEQVLFQQHDQIFRATVKTVDADGTLVVEREVHKGDEPRPHSQLLRFAVGEIEWLKENQS